MYPLSNLVEEQIKSPSPIRQIMKLAERQNIINMGLDPDKLISFGGGWVNHFSPEGLRNVYLDIIHDKLQFHKSGGYSATLGLNELRETLTEFQRTLFNLKVSMENIIIGASSTQLTHDLFRTILNPGDSVILLDPTYANYAGQLAFAVSDARVHRIQMLDPESWQYFKNESEIMERLERLFSKYSPKLILFPTPDNPTSQIINSKFVELALKLAADHKAYVVLDNAYKTQYFSESYPSYFSQGPLEFENLILIESNSKWGRGLGRRLGWVIANTKFVEAMERVQQVSVLCSDTLHQMVLARYLETSLKDGSLAKYLNQTRKEYKNAADITMKSIETELKYPALTPQGGLYTVMKTPVEGEEFVMNVLKNTGVLFVPGQGFGESLRYGVRISYGPLVQNTDQIVEGFERVGKYLKR